MSEKENIKDTAYSGMLVFGAKYKFLRGELEGSYTTKAEEKIGDATAGVQMGSLMMNLYFDIPVSDFLLPYVMLGGGAAYNHVKLEYGNQSVSNHKMNPAWQVGAGISYKVKQKLFTDLGYRYSDYGNVDIIREDGVESIGMHICGSLKCPPIKIIQGFCKDKENAPLITGRLNF